jgi:RNA polymerase sigma-70 factor (ECF subfamily)
MVEFAKPPRHAHAAGGPEGGEGLGPEGGRGAALVSFEGGAVGEAISDLDGRRVAGPGRVEPGDLGREGARGDDVGGVVGSEPGYELIPNDGIVEGGVNGVDEAGHRPEDTVSRCNRGDGGTLSRASKETELADSEPDREPQDGVLTGLLQRAAAGEEDAWSELVRMYGRRLFALARSRLGSVDLSEEIVQSVLVTVATKVTAGQYAESGRFEPWLFRVAMNRIRDEIRRRRRSIVEANGHVPEGAAAAVHDREDPGLKALRRALASLAAADREVIELRHHGALSFKQIAAVTGEPLGTLLARHHRALRKLRAILETDLSGEEIGRTT